jgi:hypothetical protein
MVFQEGSCRIFKPRETGYVKAFDLTQCAVRQQREPCIGSANIAEQNVLG